MFIAMNRFRIALGREEDFVSVWKNRDSHLDGVPGFRHFNLLRGATTGLASHLHCYMRAGTSFRAFIEVVGERGRVLFDNPLATAGSSLSLRMQGRPPEPTSPGEETTYRRQLARVVAFLERGERDVAGEDKIVATQALLDAVYRRAGLPTRKELADASSAAD